MNINTNPDVLMKNFRRYVGEEMYKSIMSKKCDIKTNSKKVEGFAYSLKAELNRFFTVGLEILPNGVVCLTYNRHILGVYSSDTLNELSDVNSLVVKLTTESDFLLNKLYSLNAV